MLQILSLLVRFTQGMFGNDPFHHCYFNHPSNPQQPIRYVKRTSQFQPVSSWHPQSNRAASGRRVPSVRRLAVQRLELQRCQ